MSWQDQLRTEGRGQGQRAMFLSLLRQRFGELSEAVVARIEAADTDELTAWTERFFRVSSPEELLGVR